MFITGLMCERALYVAKGLRRYRVANSRGKSAASPVPGGPGLFPSIFQKAAPRLQDSLSGGPRGQDPSGPSPDYMLQGFVTKSPFSVRLDPFHWR